QVVGLTQRLADDLLGLRLRALDEEKGGLALAARALAVEQQLTQPRQVGLARRRLGGRQQDGGEQQGGGRHGDGPSADGGAANRRRHSPTARPRQPERRRSGGLSPRRSPGPIFFRRFVSGGVADCDGRVVEPASTGYTDTSAARAPVHFGQ